MSSLDTYVVDASLMMVNRDYTMNGEPDRYSDTGLDDEGDFEAMTGAQRRAAERNMDNRERTRGSRASRRNRALDFLGDDDDGDIEDDDALGMAKMKRRTRWQYDERREIDDMEGAEDVSVFPLCLRGTELTQKCAGHAHRADCGRQGDDDFRVAHYRPRSTIRHAPLATFPDDVCRCSG